MTPKADTNDVFSTESSSRNLLVVENDRETHFRGKAPVTITANARLTAERTMSNLTRRMSSYGSVPGAEGTRKQCAISSRPSAYLVNKLHAVVVREPAIACTLPYGEAESMVRRLVAVVQNPIRREICDLYYMLTSMAKRQYYLDRDEFEMLGEWFGLFTQMVVVMHRAMETATESLFRDQNPFALNDEVIAELDYVADFVEEETKVRAPGDMFQALVPVVDEMCVAMTKHFISQLNHIGIRTTELTADKVATAERRFAVALRKEPRNHFMMQLALRWSKNTEFRKRLRTTYLHKGRLFNGTWKKEYSESRREFDEKHLSIVKHFFSSWNDFEKTILS